MHHRHHTCCGHGKAGSAADPRFADDEFTVAALRESRIRAAHAHGVSLVVLLLGGLVFFALARRFSGNGR